MSAGAQRLSPATAPAEAAQPVAAEWAAALIQSRRTVLPKRLLAPGPDPQQLEAILGAARAAPDHGEILPWRLVLVPAEVRPALGEAFSQALLERDAAASAEQCAQAREKAFRSPTLMLAIARFGAPADEIPAAERLVSAGCALQNMLLMATALGFGSALTSGKALQSEVLRRLFQLAPDEQAICFVSVGTCASPPRPARRRPETRQYVSCLTCESA